MAYKRTSPLPIIEGGTNATTMATTDGTVYYDGTSLVTTATGTSGQVLTSGGAGVAPSYSSAGAWVFISKQTATNSASLVFTSGISATYNNYAMIFNNLLPATDLITMFVRLSIDAGSTYIATSYEGGATRNAWNLSTWTNVNATTGFIVGSVLHNANIGMFSTIYLYNLTSANFASSQGVTSAYNSGTSLQTQQLCTGVYTGATVTVNALQVIASSGNLTSGSVSLFGIRES